MDIIREAGFPVWFVMATGTLAVVQSVRWRLGAADGSAVIAAVAATLLLGVLGTAWGAQLAFSGLRELPDPAKQGWIAWVGIKEALCNLDVACGFGIVAALVAAVGKRRSAVASAS